MTILLWWTLGSIAVSLFVGAFLQHGRHEPETLDLDLLDRHPRVGAPGEPAANDIATRAGG